MERPDIGSGLKSGLLAGAARKTRRSRSARTPGWPALTATTLAYLAAAIGTLGLPEPTTGNLVAIGTLTASVFALIVAGTVRVSVADAAIILALVLYFLSQATRGLDADLLSRKLDGILVGIPLTFFIFRATVTFGDENSFARRFVLVSGIVLGLTLVYKANYGFDDRQVRFFLNGPIVFGWLMALAAIFSIYYAIMARKKIFYIATTTFCIAILWTGSKGPIVAMIPALLYLLAFSRQWRRGAVAVGIAIVAVYCADLLGVLPERLSVLSRMLQGDLGGSSDGSIGIRHQMWSDSWELFLAYPLTGVGLGNWPLYSGAYYTSVGLIYPHNIALEILSEHGLVGGAVLSVVSAAVFYRTSHLGRAVFVFALMALMFTGDVEYLRFVIAIPLAMSGISRRAGARSESGRKHCFAGTEGSEAREAPRPTTS